MEKWKQYTTVSLLTFNMSHNATFSEESLVRTYRLLLQTWISLIPGAPVYTIQYNTIDRWKCNRCYDIIG